MKRNLIYMLLSVFALSATLTMNSCKKDDPSATETNLKRLTAQNWKLVKVTVDGVDQTAMFSDLIVQWNKDNTFAATNSGGMWPSNGTWSFTNKSGKTLSVALNNGADAEMTIQKLTKTSLIVSFQWNETTLGSGRVTSVKGNYTFEFASV